MNQLLYIINGVQGILGICPCCGEFFRLSDAKIGFSSSSVKKSPYQEYLLEQNRVNKLEKKVDAAETRYYNYKEKQEEKLEHEREKARESGRRKVKSTLKKIDPVFSGNGFNPQDVKVIFDPVEYIVFSRLNSSLPVNGIHFVSHEPTTKRQEKIMEHISKVIDKGNIEFEVIRVKKDGSLGIK